MAPESVQLAIVLGLASHPQTVIDDYWGQAQNCFVGSTQQLRAVVVYVDDGKAAVIPSNDRIVTVAIRVAPGGRPAAVVQALGRCRGALGAIGRLLTDNLRSRRVAKAVAQHSDLRRALCASDVVVAADPAADRAVWQFRNQTSALLMHGPFAMVSALRRRVAGQHCPP